MSYPVATILFYIYMCGQCSIIPRTSAVRKCGGIQNVFSEDASRRSVVISARARAYLFKEEKMFTLDMDSIRDHRLKALVVATQEIRVTT